MFSYVLIAVGLVLVAVSFFISEKVDKRLSGKETLPPQQAKDIWSEKDEKNVSERIESILSEKTEEAVVRVDDQLSQISNEKIMAVSDFSDQLLEKLEQNHSEVVFLYNMLGEKEEEIKQLVSRPVPVVEVSAATNEILKPEPAEEELPTLKEAISGLEAVAMATAPKKKPAVRKKKEEPAKRAAGLEAKTHSVEMVEGNQNEQILKLYEAGKSILEISRELGLGQGEVKLVIDLFQGVGR